MWWEAEEGRVPLPIKPFPDSDSYLYQFGSNRNRGLPSGRIPMNVQISTEEISGVNFHSLQNLIIAGNNTKI